MIYCWHLLWDISKWINRLNFRCFFCNLICILKLVFIHFKELFFFCLWNKPLTALNWFIFILSLLVRTMVYLFNITTDVLSYAYQLLFYITFFFFTFCNIPPFCLSCYFGICFLQQLQIEKWLTSRILICRICIMSFKVIKLKHSWVICSRADRRECEWLLLGSASCHSSVGGGVMASKRRNVPPASPVASSLTLMDFHLRMTEDFPGENATV